MPDWTELHFLRPLWLLAIPPAVLLFWWNRRRRDATRMWSKWIAPHLLKHLVVGADQRPRLQPIHLTTLTIVVAALAAAGPAWKREPSPFAEDTSPLVVVMDLSRTMDAIDILPTRLERAKQKVRDLVAVRPGSRTALMVYAGSAHLVLPLTEDPQVLEVYLEALTTDLMPVGGRDTSAALELAESLLTSSPVPGSVLFLTDGIEVDAIPALADFSRRRQDGLMFLAVGTEAGGPVRATRNLYRTSDSGAQLIASLDRESFERVSREADAFVTRVTIDDSDVRRLARRAETHFEQVLREDESLRWQDAGYWLVLPCVAMVWFWFRRGFTVRWAVAVFAALALPDPGLEVRVSAQPDGDSYEALLAGEVTEAPVARVGFRFADLWLTRDQQGRRLIEAGELEAAAATFEDPRWKAIAYYRSGEYSASTAWFARDPSAEGVLRLGNAYARLEQWEPALAAYKRALELRPAWAPAATNHDLVRAVLDALAEAERRTDSVPDATFAPDEVAFDEQGEEGEDTEIELEAFSEEQIEEMWLRQIQTSPADFLRAKFALQADARGRR